MVPVSYAFKGFGNKLTYDVQQEGGKDKSNDRLEVKEEDTDDRHGRYDCH